jgi:DNA-binding response OmpR family regulator
VVDDEPVILTLLSKVFTSAGYDVHTATDAWEAIARCTVEPIDAILSAVQLPRLSGHDLVHWVAAYKPAIRCALTTCADEPMCTGCPLPAACRLLAKPFNPNDAVALVEELLREQYPAE